MENEIYKEGGTIFTLDSRQVLSMHPSREDLKMMLYLFKPKYYIPVKGEYRHLYMNATLAMDMGNSTQQYPGAGQWAGCRVCGWRDRTARRSICR